MIYLILKLDLSEHIISCQIIVVPLAPLWVWTSGCARFLLLIILGKCEEMICLIVQRNILVHYNDLVVLLVLCT